MATKKVKRGSRGLVYVKQFFTTRSDQNSTRTSVEYSPAEKMEGIFVESRGGPAGSVGGDKMGAS
ncbi:unnamed protein product [Dovyalis caffra]|uniref:Uncharacterized protein n=1 Tax=Dovyalis caffra TaxID=77055 RepID=A0AAV1SSA5_9ROSI|nr:unnamed protein product [Dovyalis caffra]